MSLLLTGDLIPLQQSRIPIASVAVAVDSNTNTIYTANGGCLLLIGCNDPGSVTVIGGASDSFSTLADPNANAPLAIAVNPVTNIICRQRERNRHEQSFGHRLRGFLFSKLCSGDLGDSNGCSGVDFEFTGWGGACSGTGTCSVAMNADVSVTATFTF